VNDVEVVRHSVMHWQAPCHARPVTEAKCRINNLVDFGRAYVRVIAPFSKT
jgi:hypothetical protein